uniref:Uncharacterized protein n=1 Tax=Phytophthora fragariae TaxID=53985 RepID=A0A6A3E4R6_9STRA|nr:hypothetical protein PF009_g21021 [Phytophthora fragariae]
MVGFILISRFAGQDTSGNDETAESLQRLRPRARRHRDLRSWPDTRRWAATLRLCRYQIRPRSAVVAALCAW